HPLRQRQWQAFKANQRGYYALWLFMALFTLCLFAEFIANYKPLLVKFDNSYYTPIFKSYPETSFGCLFASRADYKDEFVRELIEADGWMLSPPIRFHHSSINYQLTTPSPSKPTKENWLGTDDQGRDVLARIIYGTRISLLFGLLLTLSSSLVGIAAGAIQGYFGGWVDLGGQRFMEVWSSMPTLYLIIILSSFVNPGFWWLFFIML